MGLGVRVPRFNFQDSRSKVFAPGLLVASKSQRFLDRKVFLDSLDRSR